MSYTLALCWFFVFGVTGYDIGWAVTYQETADFWEANPVARELFAAGGVVLAGTIRALTVLFAFCVVAVAPTRTCKLGTAAAVLIHTYLAVTYAAIFLECS